MLNFSSGATAYIYYIMYALPVVAVVFVGFLLAGLKRENRKRTGWRITTALLGVGLLPAAPFLPMAWDDVREARAAKNNTFHLTAPATYDGVAFPAGSTVILEPDSPHELKSGYVPQTTLMYGFMVIHDFVFKSDWGSQIKEFRLLTDATLTAPVKVHNVPCGPGPLMQFDTHDAPGYALTCTLAEDYTFAGLTFEHGTDFSIDWLSSYNNYAGIGGILAHALTIKGQTFPAGTIIKEGEWDAKQGSSKLILKKMTILPPNAHHQIDAVGNCSYSMEDAKHAYNQGQDAGDCTVTEMK